MKNFLTSTAPNFTGTSVISNNASKGQKLSKYVNQGGKG